MRCLRLTSAQIGLAALLSLLLSAGQAQAHHPTGGKTPETIWHGFLSGIGHPVIGPDHLAFIVAIGIAAGLISNGGGLRLILSFIAASMIGVLLNVARLNLPLVEPLVALSVVAAGLLLALAARQRQPIWLPLAAIAGLLHGYAFGEAVVGAERGIIVAYLVGIGLIASLIAWSFQHLTQQFAAIEIGGERKARVAGGMLGCVGLVMLVGSLVSW